MSGTGKPRKPQRGKSAPGVGGHVNAEDVLPDDLLRSVQVYFRGGRIYVPPPDGTCHGMMQSAGHTRSEQERGIGQVSLMPA